MIASHPLFDAYIFVDWSARSGPSPKKPTKDTIWIGQLTRGEKIGTERYCQTRAQATAYVFELLRQHLQHERRVLVGFDFPYCYPIGLAKALGLLDTMTAWRSIWKLLLREIHDSPDNKSDRFFAAERLNRRLSDTQPGPFWGTPQTSTTPEQPSVAINKPPFPYQLKDGSTLAEFRQTESALKKRHLQVQETWKLYGAGSVGSQALLGIPRIHWLRNHPDLVAHSSVWPFETGFTATFDTKQTHDIIHAEIWPGIIARADIAEATGPGDIIDQVQVRLMCRWAAEHDTAGTLGRYFARPPDLDPALIAEVINEEGWILGTSSFEE